MQDESRTDNRSASVGGAAGPDPAAAAAAPDSDLSPATAAVLARESGAKDLRLDDVTVLSPQAAAALAAHTGRLYLGGLKELPAEVAAALSGHEGFLFLSGLKTISPEAADALKAVRGHIECSGIEEITAGALVTVRRNRRLKVPSALKITAFVAAQPNMHAGVKAFFNDLGTALLLDRRFSEAVQAYQRAVSYDKSDPALHHRLAQAQAGAGSLEAAAASLEEAIRLDRFMPSYSSDLGHVLHRLGRVEEGRVRIRRALELNPNCAEAHVHLGLIAETQGQHAEAIASMDRALALAPDNYDARTTRAMLLLRQGDCAEGWKEYEWRWLCPVFSVRALMHPRWDGGPLAGRTILLTVEQGLGDTLQFIRYCPLVKQAGGRVIVSCPRRLFPLLSSVAGIDSFVADDGPLPEFDVYTSLMSLPGLVGTRLESIPAAIPYLAADPARTDYWRAELERLPGKKVGINWQGNTSIAPGRSLPLEALAPVAHVVQMAPEAGIALVSLQQGGGREQLADLAASATHWPPVLDAGGLAEAADGEAAFVETAAILQNLDLLITCDTGVAHLAGALGIPVWVLLPKVADWRWLVDRDDSPWYPTMRLFRQPTPGDWKTVGEQVAQALADWNAAESRATMPLLLPDLTALSAEAARELAKHRDFLGLNGLRELSPAAAMELAEHRGPLALNGLEKIDHATAKTLARHAGKLYLNGLKELDAPLAEALAEHDGMLYLQGLKTVSLPVARLLVRCRGMIVLGGIRQLPPDVHAVLRPLARIQLPALATASRDGLSRHHG